MTSKFFLFLLLLSYQATAQLTDANKLFLGKEILKHVNQHRLSKNLQRLEVNSILEKAALNHSQYISNIQELTHNQATEQLSTPYYRVMYFGGDQFEIVGENILSFPNVELPISEKNLRLIAEEMYVSWKYSPPHYKNMIHPKYDFTGIDFHYNESEKVIYATQVFAKKGIQIANQLSKNAFGLEEAASECNAIINRYSNIVANMGNSIYIEGEDIMFYYHDKNLFNKIFKSNQDGIAIDLISREQLKCSKENRLDISPIHDGILLKPVYKDELLRNNTAESDYRIIAKIGTIPETLRNQEISTSAIIIRNNKKCKYVIPSSTPSKAYTLRDVKPILHQPTNIPFIYEGIIETQYLIYNFDRNVPIPKHYPIIHKNDYAVHSVEIVSFSSVEGKLDRNIILHNNRAQQMKDHIKKRLGVEDAIFNITSGENWNKMYYQLKYHFADDLVTLSQDSLKYLLSSGNTRLPWDSLLYAQRQSTATVNYVGQIENKRNFTEVAILNLRTAVATKNIDLANKTLDKMYGSKSEWSTLIFEEPIFQAITEEINLVQNAAAFLSKVYENDLNKTTEFLDKWISNHEKLSKEAKYNLLILYTLLSDKLMYSWDLPAKSLSNVVHPIRMEVLASELKDNELILNLHLTFIKYYGQINDGKKITASFNFIADYFKSRILNPQDEIDLVLFFNDWSSYHLTNTYLLKKFHDQKLNEDALFILMKTLNFNGSDIEVYKEVYLEAFKVNKTRWCEYVNQTFQILRNDEMKKIYCEHCMGK